MRTRDDDHSHDIPFPVIRDILSKLRRMKFNALMEFGHKYTDATEDDARDLLQGEYDNSLRIAKDFANFAFNRATSISPYFDDKDTKKMYANIAYGIETMLLGGEFTTTGPSRARKNPRGRRGSARLMLGGEFTTTGPSRARAMSKKLTGYASMESAARLARAPGGNRWTRGTPQRLSDGSFAVPFWWRDGASSWGSDARLIGRGGAIIASGVADVRRMLGM